MSYYLLKTYKDKNNFENDSFPTLALFFPIAIVNLKLSNTWLSREHVNISVNMRYQKSREKYAYVTTIMGWTCVFFFS